MVQLACDTTKNMAFGHSLSLRPRGLRPGWRLRTQAVAVAVVGVMLAVAPVARRAPAHWRLCRYMAAQHAEREVVSLRCLAETEAVLGTDEGGGRFSGALQGDIPRYRSQAGFHGRMRRRWDAVGYQPWRSLRAELAADVAGHPPDAIWWTARYGFPPGIDEPEY